MLFPAGLPAQFPEAGEKMLVFLQPAQPVVHKPALVMSMTAQLLRQDSKVGFDAREDITKGARLTARFDCVDFYSIVQEKVSRFQLFFRKPKDDL